MIHGDWIGRWGQASPEREALVDVVGGRRYTYGELAEAVNRLAGYLRRELGVGRGDRVACLAFNRAEYLVLFFALGRLGAVLVPLNHRLAESEYAYFLADAAPRAVFCDREHQAVAAGWSTPESPRALVCFDDDDRVGAPLARLWAGLPADPPPMVEIAPDDPQLIIYTSGTTGMPKGVILTHGMIYHNAVNTVLGWELTSADRTILHPALFYTAGWNVFTLPLFLGRGANILVAGFEADQVLDLIGRERVSVFFGVPTMYRMMLESPRFAAADFSSLRFLISGGAPLGRDLMDAYQEQKGVRIWEGYGLTEIGPNNFMGNGKPGTLGHPMPGVDIRLVDDHGHEVAPGQDGEIWLRGPHCCAGYLNKPQATAEAMPDGWFHTGDLGRVDGDGHYAIVGRKKDMIISGGVNIYPAEIEGLLAQHPAVAEVAVIGVPDPKWGEVGKAVVALKPGAVLELAGLHAFLDGKLGRFKWPKHLALVTALPRTAASGKVQKFILQKEHGRPDNQ